MKIIIHRGSQEIGGTCIQISSEKATILLDAGLPLKKDSKEIDLSRLKKDAVLISHPHADHYGLIDTLDSLVPVYIGETAKNLIDATRILLGKEPSKNNFQYYKAWESFPVGDFKITPYLVDHSACDAFAFLIECEGKRIFYSGDFRGHGRKSVLFKRIVKNPPKDINLLFMEGSMLGRHNDAFPDEETVEEKIFEVIKDQKNICFLICSSQNIDRLVSVFKSCLKAHKTLVLDFYTAWVLEQLKKVTRNVPSMSWNNVKVFADYRQDKIFKNNPEYFGDFRSNVYKKYRVKKEEMRAAPENYVVVSKMSKYSIIDLYIKQVPVNIIYSQWIGYLDYPNEEYYGAEEISRYRNDPKVNFVYAHSSGHAPVEDLQTFAKAINAKMLIPIHSEYTSDFPRYFENVKLLKDNETLTI